MEKKVGKKEQSGWLIAALLGSGRQPRQRGQALMAPKTKKTEKNGRIIQIVRASF